jgi:hypothetical protein
MSLVYHIHLIKQLFITIKGWTKVEEEVFEKSICEN